MTQTQELQYQSSRMESETKIMNIADQVMMNPNGSMIGAHSISFL